MLMTRKSSPLKATNRTRKTLYVVAGFYIAIGLFMAAGAALAGDRLSAFLGFLIVSGALAAGLASAALLRLNAQLCEVSEALNDIRGKLKSIAKDDRAGKIRRANRSAADTAAAIDLTALGKGNTDLLTVKTLDRKEFPRLVTAMDSTPPAESAGAVDDHRIAGSKRSAHNTASISVVGLDDVQQSIGFTAKNLLRVWKVALRDGDLATCRSVFSALVDTADTSVIVPLSSQLQELTQRTERSLRSAFSKHLRAKDYAAALEVGDQINTLFSDSRAAIDFMQVKPNLEARLHNREETDSMRLTVVR
jgi:hypothetical protein